MKETRFVAIVAVAAMIVLAGCGAGGGGGNGTETTTGTPAGQSTATATPDPTVETVTYPEGLSGDGIENETRFRETLLEAMTTGPGYAVRMDVTAGEQTQTLRASTDPESERIRSQTDRNGELDYDIYYENGTQYIRQAGEEDTYGTTNATFRSAVEGLNGGQFLSTVLLLDLEATDVSTTDGQTVVTYAIDGPRESSEGIAGADGTVRIDTDGRLVAFEYDLVSEQDQEVSVTWERTDVGEATVEEPDWLEQAEAN
ncbi:MAG: DUF7537 family lipoprotein [Halolamina sp.]